MALSFGRRDREGAAGLRAHRAARRATASGARCSPPLAALARWSDSGGTAAECAALALAALAGGRCSAADPGLFPFRRGPSRSSWPTGPKAAEIFHEARRRRAPPRLAALGRLGVTCGAARRLRRGDLAEAEESLAGVRDAARALGPRHRGRSCSAASRSRPSLRRARAHRGSARAARVARHRRSEGRTATFWWLGDPGELLLAAVGRNAEALAAARRAQPPARRIIPDASAARGGAR